MVRTAERRWNYASRGAVNGSLAYDLDYAGQVGTLTGAGALEREEEAAVSRVRRRSRTEAQARTLLRISPVTLVGSVLVAAMMIGLLLSYVQLMQLSHSVAEMRQQLTTLQEENVALNTRYELTFDFATVKEAAEEAGMKKVSNSQIYYVDVPEEDQAQAYSPQKSNPLQRALSSLGSGICAVVEYFR